MGEYYNELKNTAKSRYQEKLQTVGLTIEDDPYMYIPEITRTISLTTCFCGQPDTLFSFCYVSHVMP